MKALTLTQPFATLVEILAKRNETRSWKTNYRGPLAIHAGKGGISKGELQTYFQRPRFKEVLEAAGYKTAADLPRGKILCVVNVTGCKPACAETTPNVNDNEYWFGDYTPGRFVWAFANVRRLETPFPCSGLQGLWNIPEPVMKEAFKNWLTSELIT